MPAEYPIQLRYTPIMAPDGTDLEKIREVFARQFSHFHLHLPEQNVRERKKGSMTYGSSGELTYIFGTDEGREYLEYFAYHRMGNDHSRIYEDGTLIEYDELSTIVCYRPNVPGDRERKEAETKEQYQKTLTDLADRGFLEDRPVPMSLAVNSYLVLHGDETKGDDAEE